MFEAIEIRKAANGFILVVTTEDETKEYVYDTSRKALRVIKEYLEGKSTQ
jgi:tRNA A37 threonylcarbamoyladenosine synthetase subunit TsaC/SUA5/YrdC